MVGVEEREGRHQRGEERNRRNKVLVEETVGEQ
jgi:hypothetical protein